MIRSRQIVLASSSPRRAELLRQIGIRFETVPAEVDEWQRPGEGAEAYVLRLAGIKATTVAERLHDLAARDVPVLGADTTVRLEGRLLGKPADLSEAREMLRALSGRAHEVLTAVAVAAVRGGQVECRAALSRSRVWLRQLNVDEVDAYCRTAEPFDKAGAYGIQGIAGIFVDRIEGSYSGIMGLPLPEAEVLLSAFGVNTWQYRGA